MGIAIIEKIEKDGKILACVIRSNFGEDGLTFPTEKQAFLQLGIHIHKKGFDVPAHKHKIIPELVNVNLEEIFFLEFGKIAVGIFDTQDKKTREVILNKGDVILLYTGHSVRFLEDSKMVEIKQGPYRGKEQDKVAIDDTGM